MFERLKQMVLGRPSSHKEIIINGEPLQTRVAVLEDGKLADFFIEHPSEERLVGSIFKGRIHNLEDGLQAAFVDIGYKKNAFIHYWDMIPEDAARLEEDEDSGRMRQALKKKYAPGSMAKLFPVGSEIVVQVTKGPIGTKGPRVTANLSIPGRYLVMMPGSRIRGVSRKIADDKERDRLKKVLARLPSTEGMGFIIRTAGEGARKVAFARDMRVLIEIWKDVEQRVKGQPAPCRVYDEPDLIERIVRDSLTEDMDRILIDSREKYEELKEMVSRFARRARARVKLYDGETPIFDHFEVEKQIESAFSRKVWLKSGGYLIFDETEALVAIDVNTGRHKGAKTQEESILQVNTEAAEEVGRQLRLRNVGGLVVIDFIDMKQRKHQQIVFKTLKEAIKRDRARTNVLPISPLGLLEMTRQRAEESIRAATYSDCPYCTGRGKIKSVFTMSIDLQRRINEVLRRNQRERKVVALRVCVNPSVMERLRTADELQLVEMEQKFSQRMTFVADPNLHIEEFVINNADSGEVLYSCQEHRPGAAG